MESTAATDANDRRRILIVEDDDRLRGVIVRNLVARGFVVDEARTVEAACSQSAIEEPSLVFLDIELPDGTGWEFLDTLAVRGCRPAVVIVSAVHARPERIAAFSPLAVLHKPFPLESLLRLAAEWAGRVPPTLSADGEHGLGEWGTIGVAADAQSDAPHT
ncbi:MAG: response regulator [Chloroflexota bacterium]